MTQQRQVYIERPHGFSLNVSHRLLLCALAYGAEQQRKWPSNDTAGRKVFDELVAFEGRFQTLNCLLFLYYKYARLLKTNYLFHFYEGEKTPIFIPNMNLASATFIFRRFSFNKQGSLFTLFTF
jgi:hypothetical protein